MSLNVSGTVAHDLAAHPAHKRGACVLIAIKARALSKTRLAEILSPQARLELVRSMLASVLSAAIGARTVQHVIVISPERDCVPAHVPVLADTGESLNTALTQAHTRVRELGCREIVVLPADLPRVSSTDIDTLVQAGRAGGLAIAPDAAGSGTNALCLISAAPFRFQFGPDSRRLHLEEAQRAGLTAQVIRRPGLEFDVDSPEDVSVLINGRGLECIRA